MIRIIVADDHGIVRQGVKQFIALDPGLRLVGDVADGTQLLALLAEQTCDVLILDLSMPGRSGVELIRRIAQYNPAPRILVLSMHNETQLVSGLSINEIAGELNLSAKTISTHKLRLMRKMDIHSNADLIRYGIEHGLTGN